MNEWIYLLASISIKSSAFSNKPCNPVFSSRTSFHCWRFRSCRYNINIAGLNSIDIVATLKRSNLIPSETEGFQPLAGGLEGEESWVQAEEEGVVTAFYSIVPRCRSGSAPGVI